MVVNARPPWDAIKTMAVTGICVVTPLEWQLGESNPSKVGYEPTDSAARHSCDINAVYFASLGIAFAALSCHISPCLRRSNSAGGSLTAKSVITLEGINL